MSEIEEPVELATELMLEATKEDEAEQDHKKWHSQVALTTLMMALLVAFGALLSGITSNEAILDRTEEAIEAATMEGDQMRLEMLKTKHELLKTFGVIPDQVEIELLKVYEQEIAERAHETALEEQTVIASTHSHLIFAVGVMLLSLGITLSGMSVIVERKWLWVAGLLMGFAGAVFFGVGIFSIAI